MLKLVLVLGCLLSLTLAHPRDVGRKRFARSSSESESVSDSDSMEGKAPPKMPTPSYADMLKILLKLLSTTTAATTTTTTATTPTTPTTAAATTK